MRAVVVLLALLGLVEAGRGGNHVRGNVGVAQQNFGCQKQGFARRLQEEEAEEAEATEDEKEDDKLDADGSSFEASASGDPHWHNFKKQHFDHMGLGEYEVARTKSGHMKYFTWQAPYSASASCVKGSVIKVGEHRIEFMLQPGQLKVDGAAVQNTGKGKKRLGDGTVIYYDDKKKICVDVGDGKSTVLIENAGKFQNFRVQIKPSAMPPKGSSCADWGEDKGRASKGGQWDFCGKPPPPTKAQLLRKRKPKPVDTFSGDSRNHLHKTSGMPNGEWPKNYKPATDAADACKKSGMKFSTAKKECKSMSDLVTELVGDVMDSQLQKEALQDCIFDYCATGEKDMIAKSMVFVATSVGGKDIDVDDGKLKDFLALFKGEAPEVDTEQAKDALDAVSNIFA